MTTDETELCVSYGCSSPLNYQCGVMACGQCWRPEWRGELCGPARGRISGTQIKDDEPDFRGYPSKYCSIVNGAQTRTGISPPGSRMMTELDVMFLVAREEDIISGSGTDSQRSVHRTF